MLSFEVNKDVYITEAHTFGSSVMRINVKVVDIHDVNVLVVHEVMFMTVTLQQLLPHFSLFIFSTTPKVLVKRFDCLAVSTSWSRQYSTFWC